MESNIRDSLDRGEIVPGVASSSAMETLIGGPPREPVNAAATTAAIDSDAAAKVETASSPTRVRTISCMNEKLLAQVQTADNILPSAQDEQPKSTATASASAHSS